MQLIGQHFRGVCFSLQCVFDRKNTRCVTVTDYLLALCVCVQRIVESSWHVADCWLQGFFFLLISLLLLCSHLLFALVSSALFFSSFSPSSRPPSSLAAVCSATCEYGITFQTPTSTVQLTKISLFSALLFCSRSADKKEEKQWKWPLFYSEKSKSPQRISMDQENNLTALL